MASSSVSDWRVMIVRASYQLCLPSFEGPLDLLLKLIERRGLEITEVSLVQVAEQYLSQLHAQPALDMAGLSDYVAIGARLLLLKSRSLLPGPPTAEPAEPDPDDLLEALREYARYRAGSAELRLRLESGARSFPRLAPPPVLIAEAPPAPQSPYRLGLLLHAALARETNEPVAVLPQEPITVQQKARELMEAIQTAGRVSFLALAARCGSRTEIVVCFVALLQLLRDGALDAVQSEPFGDILLARKVEATARPG